ncbi:hypothetical protein BD309DRAFT_997059 [Dichomitus squalens]|uniref:Uncharacterized protein n=1 Tax=Dichomitus squalens TaxID=114155 RepID=A0A4Q9Q192_9APHY|nr:hypothetical protein BD309DRAFT_997059 [Dichomitus squalens]TBU60932.1 hypothetical protein BD310DRAFT_846656 [Dichomitus squalens]
MFPSSNTFPTASIGSGQEQRPQFPHSHSHPVQYNGSAFAVAGMSSLNQSATSPSVRSGPLGVSMGSSLGMGSPLSEGLSQSRSHYQPGYLMSVNQSSSSPPGGQREEPPMVPTKAKLNHTFSGGAVTDFGMDSMFESSRQRPRQTLADEDAPPTASVNDIVNETPESTSRFPQRNAFEPSQSRLSLFRSSHPTTPKPTASSPQQNTQPLYVVVFGYPPDKYSVTLEYFRSLGDTTEAEQSSELLNCFRIGYLNPAEAIRAIRKNGDIINGSFMVGAKWADPAQAEAVLGPSLARSTTQSPEFVGSGMDIDTPSQSPNVFGPPSTSRMNVDELVPRHGASRTAEPSTPTVGTPIKLAPSTSAFRRPGGGAPVTPMAAIRPTSLLPASGTPQQSPSKGMLGQVSDLIFGW